MIEAIAVTLQDEIAAHSFDEPTGERLLACPPMLDRAIASWEANHRLERARHYGSRCHAALGSRAVCQWLVGCWNATLSWRCAPWRKLKAELTAGRSIDWSGPLAKKK